MVSPTSKTEKRRNNKRSKQGADRKKKAVRDGSTPKFPIHPEQDAQKDEPSK